MITIAEIIKARNITRICHFAPFRNILSILSTGSILSAEGIRSTSPDTFNPTDPIRLDGRLNHISATIEYPNVYYLRDAEQKDPHFKGWAALMISPRVLSRGDSLFCVRNAAAQQGRLLKSGAIAFEEMFGQAVDGAGGRTWVRGSKHPAWLPTDLQAEVMVEASIPLEDVLAIVFRDETEIRQFMVQAKLSHVDVLVPLSISDAIFRSDTLIAIKSGARKPVEQEWKA